MASAEGRLSSTSAVPELAVDVLSPTLNVTRRTEGAGVRFSAIRVAARTGDYLTPSQAMAVIGRAVQSSFERF